MSAMGGKADTAGASRMGRGPDLGLDAARPIYRIRSFVKNPQHSKYLRHEAENGALTRIAAHTFRAAALARPRAPAPNEGPSDARTNYRRREHDRDGD